MRNVETWQAKQIEIFQQNLPKKTYCCDHYDVDNRVRSLKNALLRRYIQPNNFNSTDWLVFDVDRATCPDELREDYRAPEPTLFVSNPQNRHAHVFYLLDTPVHRNASSSQKAVKFAAAVEYGLAHRLDADLSYCGLLAKNAAHPDWEIQHTIPQAYTLHDLSEHVDLGLSAANNIDYGIGRNCNMFENIRKWSYKAIRQLGYPKFEQWLKVVTERTREANKALGSNALPDQEVIHLARSVAKWTHANITQQGFSAIQAARGAKRAAAKRRANDEKRAKAISMIAEGYTQKDIALLLGVHPKTITRWKRDISHIR